MVVTVQRFKEKPFAAALEGFGDLGTFLMRAWRWDVFAPRGNTHVLRISTS